MELRIGYLKIAFSIEKREKAKKIVKESPIIQINNKRSIYVDRNAVNGINHIFVYPNR